MLVPGAVLIGLLAVGGGCSNASLDASFKKVFTPKRTPQQEMIIAVSDADPDVRREAVGKIAHSKLSSADWAVKGFVAIALLESDPQARCVAVRALGEIADPRAADTCLKILNYGDYPPAEVRPPDDLCRWDATDSLAKRATAGVLPEMTATVRDTFLDRLKNDSNRHVRIAAARGLSNFAEPEIVQALIAALYDIDLAVAHECEQSLALLTGVTHHCDPYAWEQWYEANESALFARGGTLPESRRPPYEGRWDKFKYDTGQVVDWLFPGSKSK